MSSNDNADAIESLIQVANDKQRLEDFTNLHWSGTFHDYLKKVIESPAVTRNAFQRLYDMVVSHGFKELRDGRETLTHYNFFDDPITHGKDATFGMERPIRDLMKLLKGAADNHGIEDRIILLHGPVGSAKSTVVRLLKKGLEAYSRMDAGALYTFDWVLPRSKDYSPEDLADNEKVQYVPSPMNEEPLLLVPEERRTEFLRTLNETVRKRHGDGQRQISPDGELCPTSRFYFKSLMDRYNGDWQQLLRHVRVRRLLLSEKDRVGIGTFQPKDEKNQDSTELTGDINYRLLAEYGKDSDPRAFNFDGEFCVANRGLVEFVEVLKLDTAFLYDLLGASQEHKVKPKKFAQTDIDEVIIGHTNEPEYLRLQSNELMEAFRDRTVKVDVPYTLRLQDEIKIYKRDFTPERIGKHIAPHTIDIAAMWAVLTRLQEPKKSDLKLEQKLKLYDGKAIPGYTDDHVIELRQDAKREGMEGISPRYIQDKLSDATVAYAQEPCLNAYMVLNSIRAGLDKHGLIKSDEQRARFLTLTKVAEEEYIGIIKSEVQRAIAADEDAIGSLCQNYIDNVKAYTQREKIRNKYTGQIEPPDERLMRSIEEMAQIPDSRKDDFRREIMSYIGSKAIEGRTFDYRQNDRLREALEKKLFQDQKDAIRIGIGGGLQDRETQEKIAIISARLKRNYGYCDHCAQNVLNHVASIFAHEESAKRR